MTRGLVRVHRAGEGPQLRKPRPGGWTAEKREVFLRHLAATSNVTASVKAVGMTKGAADKLRRRDAAFAQQWLEALAESKEALANHVVATSLGTAGQPDYDEEAIAAGNYPDPPDPGAGDAQMALETLRQLDGKAGRRLGRAPRMATKDQTAAAIMKLIDKVRTRQARQLAREQAASGGAQ